MKKLKIKNSAGFTLIEALVVLSVITLLMSVLLGNRSQYSDRLSLKNQTYNLLTYIRQAQVYSLGVKNDSSSGPQTFGNSYGVSVNTASPSQFIFFVDSNKDGKCCGVGEELETVQLGQGVVVDRICDKDNQCGGIKEIDITFKRPDPRAIVKFFNNGGNDMNKESPASIYLHSPEGSELSVVIDSTGQIGIK